MTDEQPEVLAEETAQPAVEERPSWLPPNFKSPEELAKSYQSAQGELTQTKQQLAELNKTVQEIAAQQEQARSAEHYGTIQGQLLEAIETGDPEQQLATMAWLAQEAARTAMEQYRPPSPEAPQVDPQILAFHVEQEMQREFSDWEEIRQDVGRVIQENPHYAPTGTSISEIANSLKAAAKIAKAERVLASTSELRATEQEALSAAKNAAQTITGASQRPATMSPADELWDNIKNAGGDSIRLGRI